MEISEQDWYRFVLDGLPVGVITVDPHRRVTYLNQLAQELSGWSEAEALGRYCGEVLRGGQCGLKCPLLSVLSSRKTSITLRSTITNRQGETIPVHFRIVGLFSASGELVGAVEAFYDISQRVALEEEREKTLSFFAHDMKSPLVSAAGFMNRLLAGKAGELSPKQRSYLEIVLQELKRVQSLVIDYLDVVRLGTKHAELALEPLDLAQSLRELARPYGERAREKGLEWKLDIKGELPPLQADARRLGRVFANLFDNAIKFTDQGEVEVVCVQEPAGFIRVEVCDQGPGLSPQDLESLFSPFFRGSAAKGVEGTGLGLAAVKAIVAAHGGEVSARNRAAGGACFEVRLPVSPAQADTHPPPGAP